MPCPSIPYGIPSGGAPEYNVNSGRELFRCGTDCTKLYIVNVSLEKSIVNFSCKSIADAGASGTYCLQSANATAREQAVVNWQAKDDVTSALPSGYVINRAEACEGSAVVCTHVEGNMSVRLMIAVEDLDPATADAIKGYALNKIGDCGQGNVRIGDLEWVLSDMNTNVSPTDWQGATITYLGFGSTDSNCDKPKTARANFNWQNGRYECAEGHIVYDNSSNPQHLAAIIQQLISMA